MSAPLLARQPSGVGDEMHGLMTELFPICRSLTGDGVRETLRILARHAPIDIHEVPSGSRCFDWQVPDEWTVREAWIKDAAGERVIDFQDNNLHLVGYSVPFEGEMDLAALRPHLHTRPDLPNAIPYVTSYYHRRWGFCLRHRDLEALANRADQAYRVKVDATLAPGSLTYGEILIPGEVEDEVLLATNICHPSMANNELSGPVLLTSLAAWLGEQPRRLSYRIVFLPETIGAIAYLSRHAEVMRARTIAGLQAVCVGGPGVPTYLESRLGDTLTDRAVAHVLAAAGIEHRFRGYARRGSDERQWCSPGIDLPVGSLMRRSYHQYAEYHTSADDLAFVRPEHMQESFDLYTRCLAFLEAGCPGLAPAPVRRPSGPPVSPVYVPTFAGCEPNLGRRGLYPTLGGQSHLAADPALLLDVLAYCDGDHDVAAIAERLGRPDADLHKPIEVLLEAGLLEAAS